METASQTIEPMQSSSIGKLALALSKAQGQMEGASKSADNPFFKSKYADLNECIQAARKPLADNELAVIQTTELSDSGIVIVTTLAHSSGEWIKAKISMKPKKDDDQGRGSSITYGRRYSFAAIVGLAQKEDDGNASCAIPKPDKTAKGQQSPPQQNRQQQSRNKKEDPQVKAAVQQWLDIIHSFEKGKHNLQQFQAWFAGNDDKLADFPEAQYNAILNAKRDKESELSV